MGSKERLTGSRHEPLINFIPKEDKPATETTLEVMDSESYMSIQIEDLYNAVNFTKTRIGALALRRSLTQPNLPIEVIHARQEALKELREDGSLRQDLTDYVISARQKEDQLYDYLQGNYSVGIGFFSNDSRQGMYGVFKNAHQFLRHLGNGSERIEASSDYLKFLLGSLEEYRSSKVFEFIKGPVYLRADGLKTKKDARMYIPSIKFRPTDLTLFRALTAPMGLVGYGLGAFMVIDAERKFDNNKFVKPLKALYLSSPHVANAIESFGLIDELLSYDAYKDHTNVPVTLPVVTDEKTHHFIAKELRNPVLTRKLGESYIPNDVELNGQRLTFLTGPNSGGKTSLCKTIAQTQVLAQIGAYIPAEEAEIAVADRILYHLPMVNRLQDEEGRFGVEAARTRDIFFQTTPRSLVILDELIEATTAEERLKHSCDILDGFSCVGGNTVLVTHNHQLAEKFQSEGRGQFLQVEFNGKEPTHRVIPGISRESHSDEVLERLGFTKRHIQKHLEESGYLQS